MFSKTQFNKTQFSRVRGDGSLSGSPARAISTATATLQAVRYLSCLADAISDQTSSCVRLYFFSGNTVNAVSDIVQRIVERIRFFGGQADAYSTSWGGKLIGVTVHIIEMPNLVMEDGDVLQIDTDQCTVTLNGENAVYLVTDDSEFFKLDSGDCTIDIEFENTGTADIRILWREEYV